MRQNPIALCALLTLIGTTTVTGCADNQVGRNCNNLNRKPTNGVSFVDPAPDCPTRLCMVTPPATSIPQQQNPNAHSDILSVCTASCETNDDCETESRFTSKDKDGCPKYVCAVPSVVPGEENYCCRKLCVCQDDLIPGFNTDDRRPGAKMLQRDEQGVPIPSVCTADKKQKTCTLTTR